MKRILFEGDYYIKEIERKNQRLISRKNNDAYKY
jgi:hypothetical protein